VGQKVDWLTAEFRKSYMRASATSSLPPLVSKFRSPLCFRPSFVLELVSVRKLEGTKYKSLNWTRKSFLRGINVINFCYFLI
jgi:hypothetical protein